MVTPHHLSKKRGALKKHPENLFFESTFAGLLQWRLH